MGKLVNQKYTYTGNFKNGKFDGKGKLKYKNESIDNQIDSNSLNRTPVEYDGNFSNNLFNGEGVMIFNNKDKYEGEFIDGIIEGNGNFYLNNGNTYQGKHKNGKFEGKGVYFISEKQISFTGDFKNNKPDGDGFYYNIKSNKKQYVTYCNGELISFKSSLNNTLNLVNIQVEEKPL